MEHLQLEEVLPSKVISFSIFRELLACQFASDLTVLIQELNEKQVLYRQPFPKLKKMKLSLNYLGMLGPNLSLVHLGSSFQRTDLPYESILDFDLSDTQLFILLRDEFFTVDLTTLNESKRVKLPSEFTGIVVAGRKTYLQSLKSLCEVVNGTVETVYTAPNRTFLQYFTFGETKLHIQYIPTLEITAVTSQSSTVFLELSGAPYTRFPVINHESSPLCGYFVHPCFVVVTRTNSSNVYLSLTGELVTSLSHSALQQPSSLHENKILMCGRDRLLALRLPTEEQVFDNFLRLNMFNLVLDLCEAASPKLRTRAFFEYGVHKFFYEHSFLEAAHFMRKSEMHWAVAALFRKIVNLPSYVIHVTSPLISEAINTLQNYSLRPAHLAIFANNTRSLDEGVLQFRALTQFIPYYQYLAKFGTDLVQLYAQAWLFDVLLTIPNRSPELLPVLSDPCNKLPLSYCEKVLLKHEKHDLLLELFLARQVVRPPLKLLVTQHQKTGSPSWLVKMQHFLSRLDKGARDFFEFCAYLFGEDANLASQLVLELNPPVLSKVDVEKDVVPHLMRYGGPDLAIRYLERHTQMHGDLLAKLYLSETLSGRLPPSIFCTFLVQNKKFYDAEALLESIPRHRLVTERLILLDILNRTEAVIHHHLKNQSIPTAIAYVRYKRSPEATNHLIKKLSQLPLSKTNKAALVQFLNESDPELFDYHFVLSTLPKGLKMHKIFPFLNKTFAYLTALKHKKKLQRRMSDNVRLETFNMFSRVVSESIEVTEDTFCAKCQTKLGEGSFTYFEGKHWHSSCYEP
mmetsp:Transcript_26075/g.46306  ORF Transcript_26075/g.46306 Transcript_26075/m.46306 type:complete len:798 (+) Transcript_26075:30-2423(+)